MNMNIDLSLENILKNGDLDKFTSLINDNESISFIQVLLMYKDIYPDNYKDIILNKINELKGNNNLDINNMSYKELFSNNKGINSNKNNNIKTITKVDRDELGKKLRSGVLIFLESFGKKN